MLKKVKCDICGHRFYIDKEKVKIVIENESIANRLSCTIRKMDAIDCPNCNCQKLLKFRMPEENKKEVINMWVFLVILVFAHLITNVIGNLLFIYKTIKDIER